MSSKEQRPVLTGQRLKSRKRDEKTKFEPEAFRDDILEGFNECGGDFAKAVKFLENSGNTLDYRRYVETFFDILIAGGILAPGGSIVDDGAPLSPFSLFGAENTDATIKEYSQMMHMIVRRYKYLQVGLEEELSKLLKFVKQFSPENRIKLARFLAHVMEDGMIGSGPLSALLTESLVKEGEALEFITEFFRETLKLTSMNSLAQLLRKAKIDDRLEEFFPQTRRTVEEFRAHFERVGLPDIVAFQDAQATGAVKRNIAEKLDELLKEEPVSIETMISVTQEEAKKARLPEQEVLVLLFDIVMASVEWNKKPDLLITQTVATVTTYAKLFAAFATSLQSQLSLLLRLQIYCYENQALLKTFQKLVYVLYQADVVSEEAVMQWYSKSHSPKGKSFFLEQMAKFVEWLKNAEEESDDDEEEEEES